jgi:hypothetical protein
MATGDELARPAPSETQAEPDNSSLVDVHDLIVALDPDIKGKFEPLSGLMMINLPNDEYMQSFARFAANAPTEDDRDLIGTINHETYHGLQAAASGYCFDRQRRQFAVFNTPEASPDLPIPAELQMLLDTMRDEAGVNPDLKARADRAEWVIRAQQAIEYFDSVAMPGDNSIFGALHPAFFRFQFEIEQSEAQHNPEGLSIQGVIEGSAVAFAAQVMRPGGGAEAAMLADFANHPSVYRELYDWTTERVQLRAFELMLPATALALCYAQPHNAYGPLLTMLASAAPGQAVALGQTLSVSLPTIPAGEAILGTSIDLRRADDSYRIYDKFIAALAQPRWPFGPYGLLADPANMNVIDTFPFSAITADGYQRLPSAMTFEELAARMYLLSLVLRKFSRRREELHIRDLQAQWAQDVLNNIVGNLPPQSPTTPTPR